MILSASLDRSGSISRDTLGDHYRTVRKQTEALCSPLATEDYVIQSTSEISPPKWHLAHTTWFFENFLIVPFSPSYQVFHQSFSYLFNSYYEGVGPFHARTRRALSRPTVDEVYRYRMHVDKRMLELIESVDKAAWADFSARVTLGLNHEQQHQELLLTDIKHILADNPLRPVYQAISNIEAIASGPVRWLPYPAGVQLIGTDSDAFAFDNEKPRHRVYLDSYNLASRTVTNGEYLEFMEASGYRKPEYWLSDGWATVNERRWQAPLYWEKIDGEWWYMTLSGMRKVDEREPVCHVSFYEADAFARWAGKRLPSEAEWELAARPKVIEGNFLESGYFHPLALPDNERTHQFYGNVWEWTQSAYGPYPGYRPLAGPLGEYNGKFMCNQIVLRGGSCATPRSHIRVTYRNFFYPADRWQFTGIRLAEQPSKAG